MREKEQIGNSVPVSAKDIHRAELEVLRVEIADYLEQYKLDSIEAYIAANDILRLCKMAGLRKFALTQ